MEKATFSFFISRNFAFSFVLLDFISLFFACIFFIYTRFEEWYASQFHYKKVDGPAPGQKYANTLSASEAGAVLGMEGSRLYEFLKTEPFDIVWADDHPRIDKHSLEEWMAQRAILETTFSATEVAAMLGVHRNTVYNLIAKGLFKTERYNDRPRIDKESFEAWYRGQKRYLKVNTRKEV